MKIGFCLGAVLGVLAAALASPLVAWAAVQADAGPNQVVPAGAVVVLNGRGSHDTRGGGISHAWRQLSGPRVALQRTSTATPSFTAPLVPGVVILMLVVQGSDGQIATDLVTVQTVPSLSQQLRGQSLPAAPARWRSWLSFAAFEQSPPPVIKRYLQPVDVGLLVLAIAVTLLAFLDRAGQLAARYRLFWRRAFGWFWRRSLLQTGQVVDARNGQPLGGVDLVVRTADGVRHSTVQADRHGVFTMQLPPGVYLLGLSHPAYAIAAGLAPEAAQPDDSIYTGDYFEVSAANAGLHLLVPVQPVGGTVPPVAAYRLRAWQFLQRQSHVWTWVVLAAGALFNTGLLLWVPMGSFLLIEALYVGLVVIKLILEVREQPSYGVVRDAITHLPMDLAVVRLYEEASSRLVMTRVTDGQGRFFALPPGGVYTLVVSKPGYVPFTREGVVIGGAEGGAVQLMAELVPLLSPAAAPEPSLS